MGFAGQAGVVHPLYVAVCGKVLGYRLRVLAVARHSERERFHALQKQERIEWAG